MPDGENKKSAHSVQSSRAASSGTIQDPISQRLHLDVDKAYGKLNSLDLRLSRNMLDDNALGNLKCLASDFGKLGQIRPLLFLRQPDDC